MIAWRQSLDALAAAGDFAPPRTTAMGCAASLMPNVSSFEAEYRNATLRRTATVPYETRLPPKTVIFLPLCSPVLRFV